LPQRFLHILDYIIVAIVVKHDVTLNLHPGLTLNWIKGFVKLFLVFAHSLSPFSQLI